MGMMVAAAAAEAARLPTLHFIKIDIVNGYICRYVTISFAE